LLSKFRSASDGKITQQARVCSVRARETCAANSKLPTPNVFARCWRDAVRLKERHSDKVTLD
jgi:hypothetical protein